MHGRASRTKNGQQGFPSGVSTDTEQVDERELNPVEAG